MSQFIKSILAIILLAAGVQVFAASQELSVDPENNTDELQLLLTVPGAQQEIEMIRNHSIEGATFSRYLVVTRKLPLQAGLNPENHFFAEQFFMFASSDWRFICQVSLNVLWYKHGKDLQIDMKESGLSHSTVCYPRI